MSFVKHIYTFLSGIYLKVFLGLRIYIYSILLETVKQFSKMVIPIHIPTNSVMRVWLFYTLANP